MDFKGEGEIVPWRSEFVGYACGCHGALTSPWNLPRPTDPPIFILLNEGFGSGLGDCLILRDSLLFSLSFILG